LGLEILADDDFINVLAIGPKNGWGSDEDNHSFIKCRDYVDNADITEDPVKLPGAGGGGLERALYACERPPSTRMRLI
jgi:hypothetical protein